jgi:hypothetical protein
MVAAGGRLYWDVVGGRRLLMVEVAGFGGRKENIVAYERNEALCR